MNFEIVQLVEVWDNDGEPVADLCGKYYLSPKDLHMGEDKFKLLLTGSKTARVRREISETIGGPGYSSVRVSTSIEVACDQHGETIKKAADTIQEEVVRLNEDAVIKAYEGLLEHRKALKLE